MATDVPSLLAKLSESLKESGFDLLTPFLISRYNEEEHIVNLPAVHKLPADGGCLAVIVGNSKRLWEPFLAWTRAQLEADPKWLESHPHALDASITVSHGIKNSPTPLVAAPFRSTRHGCMPWYEDPSNTCPPCAPLGMYIPHMRCCRWQTNPCT